MSDRLSTGDLIHLRAAVSEVALSHDPFCLCDTCLAADGDNDALMRVIVDVLEARGDNGE